MGGSQLTMKNWVAQTNVQLQCPFYLHDDNRFLTRDHLAILNLKRFSVSTLFLFAKRRFASACIQDAALDGLSCSVIGIGNSQWRKILCRILSSCSGSTTR